MFAKGFRYVQALSVVGIILALYLLWEQITHAPSICSINSVVNCDAIISGAVSKTFGIPTPLYGLVGYAAILLSATFSARRWLLGFASGGLLFCLWIGYKELFELHVVCPVCILCQLVMISVFTLAVVLNRNERN